MARHGGKGSSSFGWAKCGAFVCGLCSLYITYMLVSLVPTPPDHISARPAAAVLPRSMSTRTTGDLEAQPLMTSGDPPGLGSFAWTGSAGTFRMRTNDLMMEFMSVRLRSSDKFAPCTVLERTQMDCGGVSATWQSHTYEVGASGAALRWWLDFNAAVSQVRISAWLPNAAIEGHVDGSPVTVRRRPAVLPLTSISATASSAYQGRGPERMIDSDYDTEWFAGKGEQEAWILLEFPEEATIDSVAWTWWAQSVADEWILSSRRYLTDPWAERSSSQTISQPTKFNTEVKVSGWKEPSKWIRLQMKKGHQDPWNFGVFFGIRSFTILGRDEAASAGASDLWWEGSTIPAGIWLALEHPRARCSVQGRAAAREPVSPTGPVWRKAECTLQLAEKPAGRVQVSASMGVFEDGQYPQLRRIFSRYLELVRGREFGQTLHYNSWYDLRSAPCDESQRQRCFSHKMTEAACSERIATFNENLSLHGGNPLDAFLLDDGWDNADSLWEVDRKHFPGGFASLVQHGAKWGTKMGVWMSPFGGYGAAGARRVRHGATHGFERSHRGGFALAGQRYFASFRSVVRDRIAEGFRLFKFDGLGGGLGQSGGEEDRDDFEAMLSLIQDLRSSDSGDVPLWISLTIGTWPSPFWLLWGDSIWRDGPDVGAEGFGSPRDRWLNFRDWALRRAQARGPLFPMTAFMQHGVVWSKSAETADMWPPTKTTLLADFCKEVLSFFLAGTGLQELYIQSELMTTDYWKALAVASSFARKEHKLLRDAHAIGGDVQSVYGAAAFDESDLRGVFWWRNPTDDEQSAVFCVGELLELPSRLLSSSVCWSIKPLQLSTNCPGSAPTHVETASSNAELRIPLEPFSVNAWTISAATC
eukprot:s601_g7.t1